MRRSLLGRRSGGSELEPASGYLFNSIVSLGMLNDDLYTCFAMSSIDCHCRQLKVSTMRQIYNTNF